MMPFMVCVKNRDDKAEMPSLSITDVKNLSRGERHIRADIFACRESNGYLSGQLCYAYPSLRPILYILLTTALLACTAADEDSFSNERLLELEATVQSLQESLQAVQSENAELNREIATLQQKLEDTESKSESNFSDKEQWSKSEEWAESKGDSLSILDGTAFEKTVRLAEKAGGVVHYIEHPGRQDRTVLVTPLEFVDGETPLIVSLHGYGGNSADHSAYFPLQERINTLGFALLLPTGSLDSQGNPFWNPTDHCCDGGKSGEDDVAYLAELVAEAKKTKDFGHIYFFGYSNGGFMAHHMACKGLPGLRAVASLAGTSYVEDSSCEDAPPVSVLQIHGTADEVIRFDGNATEPDGGERAFYASTTDMVTRWSQRAGCDWPENPEPHAIIDLDQYVQGSETQKFRVESGYADGISIELWVGEGSSHSLGYGETFLGELLEWLLSQD